jgi:hypothetical protein
LWTLTVTLVPTWPLSLSVQEPCNFRHWNKWNQMCDHNGSIESVKANLFTIAAVAILLVVYCFFYSICNMFLFFSEAIGGFGVHTSTPINIHNKITSYKYVIMLKLIWLIPTLRRVCCFWGLRLFNCEIWRRGVFLESFVFSTTDNY